MQEVDKTKEQLSIEVAQLRRRIAELEKSEEILEKEMILNTLVEHVVHEDREMKILWANNAACESVDISREELIGRHCYEIWVGRSNPCPDCPVVKAMETGQPQEVEKMTPDGRFWFIRGYPLRDENDNIVGGIESTLEITERKRAEEALQESEKKYRNIFETIPISIIVLDKDGQMVDVNPYHLTQIAKGQIPKGDFVGKNIVTHPTIVKAGLSETYKRVLKGKPFYRKDVHFPLLTTGADGYFNVRGVPLLKDDEVIGAVVMHEDITERKQAEEALRESEERYRSLFENSQDAILLTAPDGSIFDVNQAACQMLNRTKEEIKQIGRNGLVDATDPRLDAALKERTRMGKVHAEITMIRADGTKFPVDVTSSIFVDAQGQQRTSMIIRDITERKKAEEALRESEERYRTLIDNIDRGINLINADHTILMVNASMGDKYNKPISKIIGKKCFAEFEKRKAVCPHCPGVQTMATGKPAEIETEGVRDDGSRFDVRLQTFPVFGQDGRVTSFIEIAEDITERKQAEEALQKSEEKYRLLSENIPVAVYSALPDEYSTTLFLSGQFFELTGYPIEQFLKNPELWTSILHPADRDYVWEKIEEHRRRKKLLEVEYRIITKNNTVKWIRDRAKPVLDENREILRIDGFMEDITDRKLAEEELRKSEEKYRSLVESSADSIYLVDDDGTYLFINKKHLSRLGVKSSQIIGRAYGEFHSAKEAEDFGHKIEEVFKTGKSLSYEYRSERDDRYFIRTLSPVKSLEDGKPTAATVISKDITDLKQAEETLREREAFNFALFHYNPVETVVVDREGKVTSFNLAKEKSGDRLPHIGDLMYKDYAGKHEIDMRAELTACIKSGDVKSFPERRYGDRYFAITISPFSQGALIISEDITERKRAEELLQKERDTFFSVLKKAPYGVILIDQDGKGILSNIEFTNITGYTLTDVPTLQDWFHLAYPDKKYRDIVIHTLRRDTVEADTDKLYQNKFQRAFFRTFAVTCKDGTVKEIEFRPTVLEDGSVIVMLADITERKRMHNLLEAAATEWRTTFDAIGDAVCLLDQHGRIKRCNNAMLDMLGKPFSEIVDRTCWEVLHGISSLPKEYPIARMQKTRRRETELFLKDNHWFNVSVDPLLDGEGNVVGAVHIMSDITDRILAEKELQNSREQLRNLSTYLESVREQERTVIAREIHDELAQALTALKMDLSWLDNRLPRDQREVIAKTGSMNDLIDSTIKTVKRISAELRPGILDDLGLVAAIEWQAEEFQDRTGIPCHVTSDSIDMVVDHDRSTAIFRIFQETLTNIARHAHATSVTVSLKEKNGLLTLRVKDNGTGITEEQITDSKAFGLIGMRERVHPWKGKVSIKGFPGKGTTVLVSVPLENRKDEGKNVKAKK